MRVFSYIGRLLILLALALLGLGVYLWISGRDVTEQAGRLWYEAHVASLNFTQVIIQRHLRLPALWDEVVIPYLLLKPTWEAILWLFIVLMVLGGLLAIIGRPRQKRHSFR